MSTTIDVYPKISLVPKVNDVFNLTMKNCQNYLFSHGIDKDLMISYELRSIFGDSPFELKASDLFKWDMKLYLWVQVDGVSGGFEVYFDKVEDSYIQEMFEQATTPSQVKLVKGIEDQKMYWSFRRSSGQAAIITLVYGYLAGSLASLIEGVVFSGDCAWDADTLPISGAEFIQKYMNPDETEVSDYHQMAHILPEEIRKEL